MAVNIEPVIKLQPVKGIRLSASSAGIYGNSRNDVVLMEFPETSTVSCVFTRNKFAAAPVIIAREHLAQGDAHRYCLINAGNANAGMGEKGMRDSYETCTCLAGMTGCDTRSILPFSTGVIGMDLPVDKIKASFESLLVGLDYSRWQDSAEAIMTTDTVAKGVSRQVEVKGRLVTFTGIAKGSGMIRPDMATMLAFIGTDAAIEKPVLDRMLKECVQDSFNRICVDGDMSTNDACLVIATGKSGMKTVLHDSDDCYPILTKALSEVCEYLATAVVRDGEGASKFITVVVNGGGNRLECRDVAYAIARSPLVKTAFFASDPNWGRILAAIGYAGIDDLDISRVTIDLNGCCIVSQGARNPDYTEEAGQAVMENDEIVLRVDLGRGDASDRVWTCDLSYDYVRINADYRS